LFCIQKSDEQNFLEENTENIIKIQAAWRGHVGRKNVNELKAKKNSKDEKRNSSKYFNEGQNIDFNHPTQPKQPTNSSSSLKLFIKQ
jgi:hypothetical protein